MIDLNKFILGLVRGGKFWYILIGNSYKYNLDCYSALFYNYLITVHEGSLTLYSSFWTILILHLLIIWVTTWVLVPSDTLSSLLWVVVAKTVPFRGFLYINAVRKLAVGHSMQWQQLFFKYFLASILPVRSRCTSPSVEFPRRSLWVIEYTFDLCFVYSRRHFSSNHLS